MPDKKVEGGASQTGEECDKSRGGGRLLQADFPLTQTKGSPHKLECMYNVIYNNKLIYLYKNIFKRMNLGGFY